MSAEFCLGIGHSSNTSVQTVQNDRAKNSNGRGLKETIHGHHNGIEATKQSSQSEKVGQDIDALAQGAARWAVDKVFRIWHGHALKGLPAQWWWR